MRAASLVLAVLLLLLPPVPAEAGDGKVPKGKELRKLVEAYLDADVAERRKLRAQWDETLAPLDPKSVPKLRDTLLK